MVGIVAAAVVTAGAAIYGVVEQRKANKETRRANERAARIEAIRGQRERVSAAAQNRQLGAEVFAQSAAAGVQGSSGVQGALASLSTQGAANQNFAQTIDQLNQERLSFQRRADGAAGRAAIAGQVSSAAAPFVKV